MHRLAIVLIVLACATSAAAGTLHVPADYDTVQDAVDVALTDDVIVISKGTYAPFVVASLTGLTIRGKGHPVVDATGLGVPAATVQDCTDVVLEKLVFRSPDDTGNSHGVLITGSMDVTVRKSTIEMIGEDGIRSWNSTELLIEKCNFRATGSDGVEFEAEDSEPPTSDSTIRKCKFLDIGDDGVDINGSGQTIEKNRFEDIGNNGIKIEAESDLNVIARNRIKDTVGDAIRVLGDDTRVEKNRIKDSGAHGLNIEGDDNLVLKNKATNGVFDGVRARGSRNCYEKNKIKNFGDGFDIEATDSEFLGNKLTACNANGIEIGSQSNLTTGNLLEGNKMSKCAENGLYVHDASSNTFRKNKGKKSGDFDLLDETLAGTNSYEDNTFGTESGPQVGET